MYHTPPSPNPRLPERNNMKRPASTYFRFLCLKNSLQTDKWIVYTAGLYLSGELRNCRSPIR